MSALTLYSPTTLSNWFDELFNTSILDRTRSIAGTAWPRVDIQEEKDRYVLRADLPGVDRKNLKVSAEDGVLTISGEKKSEKREKTDGQYAYFERSHGSFSRSFNLPDHVNTNGIEARMKDGVLELVLNKTEAAKPKTIDIKIE